MKRTVFLVRNIAPNDFGGGETYQINFAKALEKYGFHPIIITASIRLIKNAKENGISTIRAPYIKLQNWSGWRNILLPIYACWQIKLYFWYRRMIKKFNPIALNIQSRDEMIGATLAGKRASVKVFWTDHADFQVWVMTNVKVRFKNQIGKMIIRLAKRVDKIFFISNEEKRFFEKLILPKRLDNLEIVNNGVIDEKRKFNKVKVGQYGFCYIGRIVKEKGVFELIDAFLKITEKNHKVTLNLYGDGEDLQKCKAMAKDFDRIVFHGYTKNPLEAIAKNQFFILPSYHEGLSIALLEAIMMERTIIASDITGNKVVIDNNKNGILISSKNSTAIIEATEKLLADPKKVQKLAKEARNTYDSKFNIEKIFAEKLLALYNDGEEK